MTDEAFTAQTPDGPIAGSVSGTGPPLLLHGGPGMSDYTRLLAPELGGWQAVRYQQRGLAPSALGGPFTIERHVADALAVSTAGLARVSMAEPAVVRYGNSGFRTPLVAFT